MSDNPNPNPKPHTPITSIPGLTVEHVKFVMGQLDTLIQRIQLATICGSSEEFHELCQVTEGGALGVITESCRKVYSEYSQQELVELLTVLTATKMSDLIVRKLTQASMSTEEKLSLLSHKLGDLLGCPPLEITVVRREGGRR